MSIRTHVSPGRTEVVETTPTAHFAPLPERTTLVRERVSVALQQAGDAKLVYVHGPAGAGKTTALAHWLRGTFDPTAPLVWISLQDDDRGRVAFWTRVIRAIQESGASDPASRLSRFDAVVLVQAALRTALVRAFESLTTHVTINLDDFHLVDDPMIEDDVLAVLESAAPVHFVIASRVRNSLGSSLTAARIASVAIDATEFAFTLEETRALVELHGASEIDDTATAIFAYTDGWPLATRALVRTQTDAFTGRDPRDPREEHAQFVADYIERLLRRLDDEDGHLLLVTSVCTNFTLAFAAAISGMPVRRAAQTLRLLESLGVTTQRAERRGSVYTHHPYMREAIRRTAEEMLDDDVLTTIRREEAKRIEPDRPHHAFSLLCGVRDLHSANAVIVRNYSALTSLHAASTVMELQRFTAEELARYPVLLSAVWVHAHGDPATPTVWLERWFDVLMASVRERVADESHLVLPEAAVIAGMHRLMGREADTARVADIVIERMLDPAVSLPHDAWDSLPMICAVIALSEMLLGEFSVAARCYRRCAIEAEAGGLPLDHLRGINGQALAWALGGDIVAARRFIDEAENFDVLADWEDHFGGTNLRIARAWVALEAFDVTTAARELDALEQYEPGVETWPLIAVARCRTVLYERGPAAAEAALERTLARHRARPASLPGTNATLIGLRAILAMLQGKGGRALTLLQGAGERPELDVVRAMCALVGGNAKAALDRAYRVLRRGEDQAREAHRVHLEAMLIAASAEQKLGLEETARATATTAFGALASLQLATPLTMLPRRELDDLLRLVDASVAAAIHDKRAAMPDLFAHDAPVEQLSAAETRVLTAIAQQQTIEKTAETLFVSPNTVKHHLKNIYRKLGVASRRAALDLAIAQGIIAVNAVSGAEPRRRV